MKYLVSIILFLALAGCDLKSEVFALSAIDDSEKIWVFTQLNVREEEDGLESYYYYAKISKKMYDAISTNSISNGFLLLEEVMYWGENDLIYEYKDIESEGDIIFRVEDIVRMNRLNVKPIPGMGYEQFEEQQQESESETD